VGVLLSQGHDQGFDLLRGLMGAMGVLASPILEAGQPGLLESLHPVSDRFAVATKAPGGQREFTAVLKVEVNYLASEPSRVFGILKTLPIRFRCHLTLLDLLGKDTHLGSFGQVKNTSPEG